MERMRLVIRRKRGTGCRAPKFMDGQLDESSPNFHTWLTREQFGDQFGPSELDLCAVTSRLESHVSRLHACRTAER
jgi:hypothetical protein